MDASEEKSDWDFGDNPSGGSHGQKQGNVILSKIQRLFSRVGWPSSDGVLCVSRLVQKGLHDPL